MGGAGDMVWGLGALAGLTDKVWSQQPYDDSKFFEIPTLEDRMLFIFWPQWHQAQTQGIYMQVGMHTVHVHTCRHAHGVLTYMQV